MRLAPARRSRTRLLALVEEPVRGGGEGPLVGQDPLHQHGRGERRPDLADRGVQRRVGAHLGVEGGRRGRVLPARVRVAQPRQPPDPGAKGVATDRERHVASGDLVHRLVQGRRRDPQPSPGRADRDIVLGHLDELPGRAGEDLRQAGVALEPGELGRIGSEHPAAHEALDRGLAGRRLPERRQDLRDVPEEQRVRTHDQHALLVELLAMLEQEERRSVEPHRGLAGAGTALHHEAGVDGGPDHHVLLGGDRGHDVAHLAGAGALELGEERIRDPPVVGRVDAVRIVEHLVEQVVDLSSGHQEPAPPAQLHRVGRGRSVEGRGHGRSPVDHDRIAALVLHVPAPDVPGVAVLGVEAAEGEAVDVRVERAEPGVQVGPCDGRVDGLRR